MLQPHAHREAVTVDRREGPYGEIVLRRRDTHFEIIANGTFLMDTSDDRSGAYSWTPPSRRSTRRSPPRTC